jgi:hypothetical protein
VKDIVKNLQQLTQLTQLSFLGLQGDIRDQDDAAIWDRVAGTAWLSVEAAGCNWAFVSKVRNEGTMDR